MEKLLVTIGNSKLIVRATATEAAGRFTEAEFRWELALEYPEALGVVLGAPVPLGEGEGAVRVDGPWHGSGSGPLGAASISRFC